jgi:hypothetical protein
MEACCSERRCSCGATTVTAVIRSENGVWNALHALLQQFLPASGSCSNQAPPLQNSDLGLKLTEGTFLENDDDASAESDSAYEHHTCRYVSRDTVRSSPLFRPRQSVLLQLLLRYAVTMTMLLLLQLNLPGVPFNPLLPVMGKSKGDLV